MGMFGGGFMAGGRKHKDPKQKTARVFQGQGQCGRRELSDKETGKRSEI